MGLLGLVKKLKLGGPIFCLSGAGDGRGAGQIVTSGEIKFVEGPIYCCHNVTAEVRPNGVAVHGQLLGND